MLQQSKYNKFSKHTAKTNVIYNINVNLIITEIFIESVNGNGNKN